MHTTLPSADRVQRAKRAALKPAFRGPVIAALALLPAGVCAGGTLAAGDPAVGQDLAITWCSACHAMEGGQPASDAAPALATVAKTAAAAPDRVRGFLALPHGDMAELYLSRREIEDLVAYLQTLR